MKWGYIYVIRNKTNDHFYIGSTFDLQKRKNTHFNELRKNKHHSKYLQNAFNKYGEENFEFRILFKTNAPLRLVEQTFMDKYKPVYNVSKNVIAPMQGRKHSKSTLRKFKKRRIIKGKDHHCFGKKQTREHIEKSIKSRTGLKRSEKTKRKMRKKAKELNYFERIKAHIESQKKKIIDNNGVIYESLSQAEKLTKCSKQAICDNLKGRSKKTRKGLTFKYLEKNDE